MDLLEGAKESALGLGPGLALLHMLVSQSPKGLANFQDFYRGILPLPALIPVAAQVHDPIVGCCRPSSAAGKRLSNIHNRRGTQVCCSSHFQHWVG